MEITGRFIEPPRQSFFLFGPRRSTVVIDEVQRVPELLQVVHAILESNDRRRFVLTGSSARKLRRGGVNRTCCCPSGCRRSRGVRSGTRSPGTDYPQAGLVWLYRGTRRERRGRVWILPVGDCLRAPTPANTLPVSVEP